MITFRGRDKAMNLLLSVELSCIVNVSLFSDSELVFMLSVPLPSTILEELYVCTSSSNFTCSVSDVTL